MKLSIQQAQFKIVSIALLLLASFSIETLHAVPAKPGVIKVEQADGTSINILLNGDEYFNYRTTESGYPIAMGSDGFYYYTDYATDGTLLPTAARVSVNNRMQTPPAGLSKSKIISIAQSVNHQNRIARCPSDSDASTSAAVSAFPSKGTIRSAVILVEFADVKFSVNDPHTAFNNQLNKVGYSVEGAVGSARDYFLANSHGQFEGQFDVYGPYTLPNSRAYYGGNDNNGTDMRPEYMTYDAVTLADKDGVDFSVYDYDDNGFIDNIFVYYAGHNEAEGGSKDSVWPHKYVVNSKPTFDGKTLYVYACTSELRGSSGTTIAGIGTFCHEFSHVFGLADHYDTDGTQNGYSEGLGRFDLMTFGSYNNDGNSPALHTALELEMIGWAEPVVVDRSQEVILEPIENGVAYKILTETEGEYFLLENRYKDAAVWDNYLEGEGLLITHVDRSSSAMGRWAVNGPNNYLAHECYRLIVAGNSALNNKNWYKVAYPYSGNNSWTSTSSPAAKSWGGLDLDFNVIDIEKLSNGNISFKVISSNTDAVNLMINSSDKAAYVAEPFTLTCSTYPEQTESAVTWSSSDNSVATIDAVGNVLFSKVGSATFTATLSSDASISSSISFTAKALQGAKGIISDNDDNPISNADLTIYPVTRSLETVNGVQSAVYTRVLSTTYKSSTNYRGEYKVELPAGIYEAEISCPRYVGVFEIMEVGDGATEVDFALSSYAESVDEVEVEANQNSATISWNPQSYTSFKVVVTKGFTTIQLLEDQDNTVFVDGLTANNEYTVAISALEESGDYTELYNTTFKTLNKPTTLPIIHIDTYEYSSGDSLELKVLNTSSTTDSVSWFFDGVLLNVNKVALTPGKHTITAVVERGSTTYKVNRMINVK